MENKTQEIGGIMKRYLPILLNLGAFYAFFFYVISFHQRLVPAVFVDLGVPMGILMFPMYFAMSTIGGLGWVVIHGIQDGNTLCQIILGTSFVWIWTLTWVRNFPWALVWIQYGLAFYMIVHQPTVSKDLVWNLGMAFGAGFLPPVLIALLVVGVLLDSISNIVRGILTPILGPIMENYMRGKK